MYTTHRFHFRKNLIIFFYTEYITRPNYTIRQIWCREVIKLNYKKKAADTIRKNQYLINYHGWSVCVLWEYDFIL